MGSALGLSSGGLKIVALFLGNLADSRVLRVDRTRMGRPDPAELSRWFDAHGDALVLYARQWLDREAACDVVQDVFVRLASQRRRPDNIRAWLFRAVRNAALNRILSDKIRQRHNEIAVTRRTEWFVAHPGDRLDAKAAEEALSELPEDQREAVILRIWGGLTLAETAEIVARPISTVQRQYTMALQAIRRRMTNPCEKRI